MNFRTSIATSCFVLLAAGSVSAADPAVDRTPATQGQGMRQGMHKGMDQDMHKGMGPGGQGEMGKGMGTMPMHAANSLKWGAAPPSLPRGAQLAVLQGDPMKEGPYVIRLKMPSGYQVPPHWHSRAENVTLISGQLALGMGDTLDLKSAQTLKPGDFHSIPAQQHHFAVSRTGAVVQIHGEGPFDITYVNPADNPAPAQ